MSWCLVTPTNFSPFGSKHRSAHLPHLPSPTPSNSLVNLRYSLRWGGRISGPSFFSENLQVYFILSPTLLHPASPWSLFPGPLSNHPVPHKIFHTMPFFSDVFSTFTQWTRVWANSRRWWRTGKPAVLQTMGPQRVRHDQATEQQVLSQEPPRFLLFPLEELTPSICNSDSQKVMEWEVWVLPSSPPSLSLNLVSLNIL